MEECKEGVSYLLKRRANLLFSYRGKESLNAEMSCIFPYPELLWMKGALTPGDNCCFRGFSDDTSELSIIITFISN